MGKRRVAIVTGAGSGIGRAAAVLLAGAGYSVVLVGRTAAKLQKTAATIQETSPRVACEILAVDICNPAACQRVIKTATARLGRIDAIVHAAGHAQVCEIGKITPDEWRRTIDTNVSAAMYLTRAAWPVFRRQKGGVIVNVSSMAGVDPFPGFAMYAPSKAALNMFTLITAREGEAIGLRAVSIAPGAVETPMLRWFFSEQTLPRDKAFRPEKIGAVIRDCVTGKRRFKNGETIQMPSP